jgi:hypothetical protein
MKALAPHFGAYALYNTDDSDILIIATRGPTLRTPDDLLLQSPALRVELDRVGIQSVADIKLRKIGDNLTIGPLLQTVAVPANSDFYPFVDLNAPRLRYMRQNASELPALTYLPIPFLDLLEGAAPAGTTVEPSPHSVLLRDRLVRRALEIRNAVATDSLNTLDPQSAAYLWRIYMSGDACAAKTAQSAWVDALRNISDYTSAYLNPAELEELWNKVMAGRCYRAMADEHKTWADLLAAVARRNAPQIVKFGTELLASHSSNADGDLAYLTTITAAAQIRMGEVAQARSLLQAQWRRFKHAGQFDLALRELLALTQSASGQ